MAGSTEPKTFLQEVIHTSKKALNYVLLFSFAMNMMMLALPIYSLQVLDRVVNSRSMETLTMLSLIIFFCFLVLGAFTALRSLTLIKLGEWFDHKVGEKLLKDAITIAALYPSTNASQNLRDAGTLKTFLTGPALSAIFDAPWAIIFIAILFAIHPVTGFITLIGGIILLLAALLNERAVKSALNEANEEQVKSMTQVDASARNAEVIEAMGMMDAVLSSWKKQNEKVVEAQAIASRRSAIITAVVKVIRMTIQIMIIGAGAYLVTHNEMTVGAIIACSIISGRALAPFEQAIAAWSGVSGAKKAYERLQKKIRVTPDRQDSIDLPVPEGNLSIEKLVYALPTTKAPIIKGINFSLNAGESLGIIGPSAAGKSTLAKLLTGVYRPNAGNVRLDGADVYSWNRRQFGKFVGYLPQDVELFEGTVKENIARMQPDASDEEVVKAAQISGTHDMILRLPEGYETRLVPGGVNLSAGQRQRIGLARAFYGTPRLLVLDEPNANLDDAGEHALSAAIRNAKAMKITTLVIAHRPAVLNFVDKVLVLKDGTIADFGPTRDVMAKYTRSNSPQQAAPQVQQQAQQKDA